MVHIALMGIGQGVIKGYRVQFIRPGKAPTEGF